MGFRSPFTVGNYYRVRRDFTAHGESFTAGEKLVYRGGAYSQFDGFTGYSFQDLGRERLRSWEVFDDEDVEIWRELFEEIPAANAAEPANGSHFRRSPVALPTLRES